MNWVDVCGPPGVGKSTLCDPLWGPHEVRIEERLPPYQWQPFLDEITRLLGLIRDHWSFEPAVRMNRRSIRKIATVARQDGWTPYVQTALVQRGLGFGWRLNDLGRLEEVRPFFETMPVSIGVAFLSAPQDAVEARNRHRETVKATAHENRAFMVPLMLPAIEIAREVMRERGVPTVEIDTTQPLDVARGQIADFARHPPFDPEAAGPCSEVEVLQPPAWW